MTRHVVEERFGLAAWSGPVVPMAAPHRHDDLEISVPLGGRVVYRIDGDDVEVPEGCAAVFWPGQPHQLVEVDPGARLQWATVPRSLVARWGIDDAGIRAAVRVPLVADAVAPLPERWQAELASGDAVLSAAVELEAQALVLRIARQTGAGSPPRGSASAADRMARFMSERFAEPLSIADVAAAGGLGVSQAMAVFRRDRGTTIGAYLTDRRVDEAMRLLRTTTRTTDRVVLDAGFGSVSAGYEAFRRATGEPPARWRRRQVQGRQVQGRGVDG